MKQAIQFVLRGYKRVISPMLPHACRFVPTCSEYAMEAVELHGALRGSWLAAARLARCHPFARAGFDPVPARNVNYSTIAAEQDSCPCRGEATLGRLAARCVATHPDQY